MSEATELAVQEERALLAQLEESGALFVAGEENLAPGDIGMPPRLRISQPNRPIEASTTVAPPGSIVNTLTGEIYEDGLEIVPLVFLPRTRVMWPEDFKTTNDPLCASDDGVMPSQSADNRTLTSPQLGPCADCPFSQFGENGEAPPCKLQRNFLVMVVDGDEPEPTGGALPQGEEPEPHQEVPHEHAGP